MLQRLLRVLLLEYATEVEVGAYSVGAVGKELLGDKLGQLAPGGVTC